MKKIIDYWTTETWMTKYLGLRGIKKDIFAIIYNFSKDLESTLNSAPRYLEEITGYDRSSISNAISELQNDKLITIEFSERFKYKYKVVDNIIEVIKNAEEKYTEEQSIVTKSNDKLNSSLQKATIVVTKSNDEKSTLINNNTIYKTSDKYRVEFSDENPTLSENNQNKIKEKVTHITDSNTVKLSKHEDNTKEPTINVEADSLFDIFSSEEGNSRKSRLAQTLNSNGSVAKELFDYWNSKKLRVHRAYQSKYLERLNKFLELYSLEYAKQVIDNYEKIIHDSEFYWTYVWDLQDFIDVKEERFLRFVENGDVWDNYKTGTKGQQSFKKASFHNEEYNKAISDGEDISKLDDKIAEKQKEWRKRDDVIHL
ncbi:MAG: hypothetical protein RR342_03705 [Bacilli bacterium]